MPACFPDRNHNPPQVYGISADKPDSQAKWRTKEGLTFNLLCDPSKEVRAQQLPAACSSHLACLVQLSSQPLFSDRAQ